MQARPQSLCCRVRIDQEARSATSSPFFNEIPVDCNHMGERRDIAMYGVWPVLDTEVAGKKKARGSTCNARQKPLEPQERGTTALRVPPYLSPA